MPEGRKVGFNDPVFAGAKIVDISATLTNVSGGSVSLTVTDERVVGSMQLISLEIGNPEAVGANIDFHPTFGELTITCDFIEGSTTIKAYFMKVMGDPTAVTSSEYDILNNKIELIKNVDVNFPITIETTDWTLDSNTGEYIYTWINSAVTTECSVDVQFLESQDNADVDIIGIEKVTGGVQFSVEYVPSEDIPVNIKITNTRPKAIEQITGEMVATDVISGASNVDEALGVLDGRVRSFTASTHSTVNQIEWTDLPDELTFDDIVLISTKITLGNGYTLLNGAGDINYYFFYMDLTNNKVGLRPRDSESANKTVTIYYIKK